jgi:beta-glucosidase
MTRTGTGRAIAAIAAAGLLAASQLVTLPGTASAAPSGPAAPKGCPWMNTHKSADQRARLLLSASTLDQKLRWLDEQAANSPTQTSFGRGNQIVTYPVQVPCTPTVVYTDGPDYVRGTAGATIYPAQLALAASWSAQLAFAKGQAQADEAFRSRKNVILGPGISSSRTPLAGRTPEYLGEDPLLSGELAAADISGIQNGNRDEPVLAVVKHYVANEQELDRQTSSSNMAGRTLREVYDLPFAIALNEGRPGGVMCSYNQVNGVYACENPILNNVLKAEHGFPGYVVSDFGAVHSTGPSLTAGLDQELNVPKFFLPANIHAALDAGQVTLAQIDAAALRVVRAYIGAGLFDHPLPETATTTPSTPASQAVSERIAERGSVLLKNADGVLPLTRADSSIAVIGPTASNVPANGISAATVCAEGGVFQRGNPCANPVAPLDAITARAALAGATVTYDNGADPSSAATVASSAKAAIVFVYAKQGEGADRTSLSLDGNGEDLISAVAAANPNTVVVLETGTAVVMPWLDQVRGVIEAWYPGDQQGTALARLLFGDADFTGRLPMTFPKSLADTPTATPAQYPGVFGDGSTTRAPGDTAIRQVSYSEGLAVGHKWYESNKIPPLFPFGYGLSYTRFDYSNLQATPSTDGHHRVTVRFDVRNAGTQAGVETPQVYLALPTGTGEPGQRLVGFDQATLSPGQAKRITIEIDPSSADHPLSYWDTAHHAWATAAGTYEVHVGGSSQTILSGSFDVAG